MFVDLGERGAGYWIDGMELFASVRVALMDADDYLISALAMPRPGHWSKSVLLDSHQKHGVPRAVGDGRSALWNNWESSSTCSTGRGMLNRGPSRRPRLALNCYATGTISSMWVQSGGLLETQFIRTGLGISSTAMIFQEKDPPGFDM